MGDLTDEEVNCRLFSRDLGAVCLNVDYRCGMRFKVFGPLGLLTEAGLPPNTPSQPASTTAGMRSNG